MKKPTSISNKTVSLRNKKKTHIEFKVWFDFVHFLLHFIRYFSNSIIIIIIHASSVNSVKFHFSYEILFGRSSSTFHWFMVWYVVRGWYSQYSCIDRQQVIEKKPDYYTAASLSPKTWMICKKLFGLWFGLLSYDPINNNNMGEWWIGEWWLHPADICIVPIFGNLNECINCIEQ